MWFEMHNHSEFSMFDGFDKVKNKVAYAKEIGMKALAITDHGNTSCAIQLYKECRKNDMKPLIGCEVYFQPTFKPGEKRFHLCLFAYNRIGYQNLNQIITKANKHNYYRYGHVTFDLLEQHSEGLICTSGCISAFIPKTIVAGKKDLGMKAIKKFLKIFGGNFYFEVQPISIADLPGDQEKSNETVMKLAKSLGVKCIMTTDAHYTRKEDFDTYCVMHQISKLGKEKGEGFTMEHIRNTYGERYMHSEAEIVEKFKKMHGFNPKPMLDAMDEIYNKIDIELNFDDAIPSYDDAHDSFAELKTICIERLKSTDRYNSTYIDRLKYEIGVIRKHDLCDYFLIVRDYIKFARENGIYVGPGRGSVCGSLVAECLEITKVDPIEFGTDFERFLREDRKKMPDIDIDFESGRRDLVFDYLMEKYKGRVAQIVTFGYNKEQNIVNDLCKVLEVPDSEQSKVKSAIKRVTSGDVTKNHVGFVEASYSDMVKDRELKEIDRQYDGLVKHFCKLYGQVRYYGQHPAGIVITKDDISKHVALLNIKGQLVTAYDLYDVDDAGLLKFDLLAIRNLNVLHNIEEISGDYFDRNSIEPDIKEKMYNNFAEGNTCGIFQFGSNIAKDVLTTTHADKWDDVVACVSLNRPGTLSLGMHKMYAENKMNPDKHSAWYKYTSDAYGTILYQEQIIRICKGMADMDSNDIDKIIKIKFTDEEKHKFKKAFVEGCKRNAIKITKAEAEQLFESMCEYMFNKSHAVGYALISEWQMYHKVKRPTLFWLETINNEPLEKKRYEYIAEAARDGIIFFLPHVNYSHDFTLRRVDDEDVIQMGYSIIKNVGEKAAIEIYHERKTNGPFKSYDDFVSRVPKRTVNSRVVDSLVTDGALEFDKKSYINRVIKYNSTLYMKGMRQ